MQQLTIALPDNETELRLFPVERVMPLIKRYTRQSPELSEVIEAIGECQEQIGHNYGCEYVTLVPVERDGMAYLPIHCRKVVAVHAAPWAESYVDLTTGSCAGWDPAAQQGGGWGNMPGRQWVADQIRGSSCWRDHALQNITMWTQERLAYRRTELGVHIPCYKRPAEWSGYVHYAMVIYDAELTDERGYPLVSDRDAQAGAWFWNWQRLQADLFAGIKVDGGALQLAEYNMNRSLAQARIGEGLSEAGWDLILRSAGSWDRTSFKYGLDVAGPLQQARRNGQYGTADGY